MNITLKRLSAQQLKWMLNKEEEWDNHKSKMEGFLDGKFKVLD